MVLWGGLWWRVGEKFELLLSSVTTTRVVTKRRFDNYSGQELNIASPLWLYVTSDINHNESTHWHVSPVFQPGRMKKRKGWIAKVNKFTNATCYRCLGHLFLMENRNLKKLLKLSLKLKKKSNCFCIKVPNTGSSQLHECKQFFSISYYNWNDLLIKWR